MKLRKPFYIVGSPRSGTTLLQAMLASSTEIYIPPETHFFDIARQQKWLPGTPISEDEFERFLEAIRVRSCNRNELPVQWTLLEQELRDTDRTHAALFNALLNHIRVQRHPSCRIGEKTPGHLLFAEYLLDHHQESQIINVIRDPRDVVVSHSEAFDSHPLHTAIRWRRNYQIHLKLARKFSPLRYTTVKYEDLVTNPEQQIKRLCEFLGQKFDQKMLNQHERKESGFAARESHKTRTLEPVTQTRVKRYRGVLKRRDIAMIQSIVGTKTLTACGYEKEKSSRLLGYSMAATKLPSMLLWRRSKIKQT